MQTPLLRNRRSEWYERVQMFLVLVTERVTSLRSGIFWTLSYVLLLALMYLFHSPFRSQLETRTDWYAQVTKGLQIWLAVVLLCFHVGPQLVESRSAAASTTATRPVVTDATQHIPAEDAIATIFFPTFCFTSSFCLLLHKIKRRYKLAFTYGPSFAVVMINSVLLSSFALMHYTTCSEVFSTVEMAVGAPERTWAMPFIGSLTLPSTWLRGAQVLCPQPVVKKPFACIAFMCALCVAFVWIDYLYKKHVADGDPSRGILWADMYPEKARNNNSPLAASSRASFFRRWGLRRARPLDNDVAKSLGLPEGDPRLQEAAPQTISLLRPAKQWGDGDGDADPNGWQDENDRLGMLAEKYVSHPTNRPGMVPWFSTFIMTTTWQALARMSLEFLTFDVRVLQHYAKPKVFEFHFGSSLKELPHCCNKGEQESVCTHQQPTVADASPFSVASPPTPLRGQTLEALAQSPSKTRSKPQLTEKGDTDIWFDWISDVGDGFNPTYAMARLLARPSLQIRWHRPPSKRVGLPFLQAFDDTTPTATPTVNGEPFVLPRGSFVLVGGDLAYPSPNDETYTTRLFDPYHDAMSSNVRLQSLFHAEQRRVVVEDANDADVAHVHLLDAETVSRMATGRSAQRTGRATAEEALRSVPLLFAIPGNHDWFDGLTTYRKYILERTWIGGWLMPQRSSFFVLRLPHNWFVLCGDTGNMQDIDVAQRNYFLDVIEKYMDAESCVILAAHEPGWVYDSMLHKPELTQPELAKVAEALGTRLRLRLAGDIHHYSRHTPRDANSEAATLVVSGGGGAFLHGPRNTPVVSQKTAYQRACAFPARNTLPTLLSRLLGFRVINWKFDFFIGVFSFLVVVSLLPQSIKDVRGDAESNPLRSLPDAAAAWWERVCIYVVTLFNKGIASVLATLVFFAAFAAAGAEKNTPAWMRLLHSSFWTFLTVFVCCGMLAYLICTLQYMMDNDMLVSADGHWGSAVEDQVRASVDSLLNHTQQVLGGPHASVTARELQRLQTSLYGSSLVRWCGVALRCLDPFEMLAYLSEKVSLPEMGTFAENASRLDEVLYYLYFVFFYWILVTPLVSFVIGSYLMCCVTFFDSLFDATYSAFQIEECKHFVRFRLDAATRELHAYVIIMSHVPKSWCWDAAYQKEISSESVRAAPPHLRAYPSRWHGKNFRTSTRYDDEKHVGLGEGMEDGVEILEHFVCAPHRPPTSTPSA
ncbi:metallo-dependent phosphatase-like domain-containing protein [Leishmania tarentolae]|uniref:Metallo-dependent phosphatase-like domain-containing protein n=1 Tax=Leishmania tarentolae TaxID=5689 RepID=A0A640KFY0_LEITA|nr:metallo-dependent phosphatase-like domain-containing protein [Leishmania tarentolae]